MYTRHTDAFILNCIKLNAEGMTFGNIRKLFGIKHETLIKRAKSLGYELVNNKIKNIPENELINLFNNGMSVKQLAEKFGVSRGVITNRLIKNGIKPRNRSESMYNRMALATEEERKNLTHKANIATRGKSADRKRLKKSAITRINKSSFIGFGEKELEIELIKRGFNVFPQFAFDIYNIDLVINGNIAVEVRIGNSNPFIFKKHIIKTKKLIDAGFGVVWVCASSKESFIANLSNFIAYLDIFCSDPSSIRQYRVVSGYFESAHRQNERGQFTGELTFKNPKIREWTYDIHITD